MSHRFLKERIVEITLFHEDTDDKIVYPGDGFGVTAGMDVAF